MDQRRIPADWQGVQSAAVAVLSTTSKKGAEEVKALDVEVIELIHCPNYFLCNTVARISLF